MEKTLSIIKPDAVERNLIGQIVSIFEKNSLTIHSIKKIKLSKKCKTFFNNNLKFWLALNNTTSKFFLSLDKISKVEIPMLPVEPKIQIFFFIELKNFQISLSKLIHLPYLKNHHGQESN